MVVCVLLHRLALLAALGDRGAQASEANGARAKLVAEPVALAPEAGRKQLIGEASPRAEAFGVTPGMRVGEALSRCPELRLVAPDPEAVRELWNALLDRLEGIGAAVESDRPGAAYFDSRGIERLHRGGLEGVLHAARKAAGRG